MQIQLPFRRLGFISLPLLSNCQGSGHQWPQESYSSIRKCSIVSDDVFKSRYEPYDDGHFPSPSAALAVPSPSAALAVHLGASPQEGERMPKISCPCQREWPFSLWNVRGTCNRHPFSSRVCKRTGNMRSINMFYDNVLDSSCLQ